MAYQLNINIDQAGLSSLYSAGQVVALIGAATSPQMNESFSDEIWVTFQPLEKNIVVWNDSYYIYATTDPTAWPMVMNAQTADPAQPGWLYTFADGFFQGAAPATQNTAYNIANGMQDSAMYFGLARDAAVNDGTPVLAALCSMQVASGKQASLSPSGDISIYVVTAPGTPGPSTSGPALTIAFSSENPTVTVEFDDTTNAFAVVPAGS